MVKVLADESLGYDETETFEFPEDYDPCKSQNTDANVLESSPSVELDDLFN